MKPLPGNISGKDHFPLFIPQLHNQLEQNTDTLAVLRKTEAFRFVQFGWSIFPNFFNLVSVGLGVNMLKTSDSVATIMTL